MRHGARQIRLVLFVVAGLLGLTATYIRLADILPLEPHYVTSATFRSELLAGTLPFFAVQSVVAAPEFQRAAGSPISIASASEDPASFHLSSKDAVQPRAEVALERSRELLVIKLRALALSEIEASKSYLAELRDEAFSSQTKRSRPADPPLEPKDSNQLLSDKERERAVRLREEVQGLERFLRYQDRPEWFDARVDSKALDAAQRAAADAKSQLLQLRELFTDQSAAVKAQTKLLHEKRKEIRALETHLARTLLNSHRNDLKVLEAKVLAAVKQSRVPPPAVTASPAAEVKPDLAWLEKHSQRLAEQSKALESAAALRQTSNTATKLVYPMGYWLSIGLWVSALGLLVGALFVRRIPRPGKPSIARETVEKGLTPVNQMQVVNRKGLQGSQVYGQLAQLIVQETGGLSKSLLILGQDGQERASLSLSLAHQFSLNRNVRLADFDFQFRPLSARVGEPSSPGVSDLLTLPGPAEEFFASLPGTSIEFAPAGTLKVLDLPPGTHLDCLLPANPNGLMMLDASFSSPLHLLKSQVDAVVCLYRPGTPWTDQQANALSELQATGTPILGVAIGTSAVSRFL